MSTPVGIIKKFVEALTKTKKTGTEAVDEALRVFGINGGYSVFKQKFSSDLSGKSDQDFLEQICGVRLNNKDTGAITGSDAGGSTTKTNESIVPETAAAKELTDAQYNSFTKNGLTVNVTYDTSTAPGANFNYDSETYLAKQKLVVRALYNWWIPESLDLINQSLGINFTDGRANINEINVVFKSFSNDDTATFTNFSYDMGRASEVTLQINANLLYNMTANDKNGTLDGQKLNGSDLYSYSTAFTNYLDRLLLLSLSEIALKANVPYVDKLPWRIAYGLCEIVGGYDSASVKYYSDFTSLGYDYDATESYYSNYKSYDLIRTSGYTLMRYLAKNYSDGTPDETLPTGLSYNDAKTVLTASTKFTGSKIDLADYVTTVKTVDASKRTSAIQLSGNTLDNSIVGGTGNDKIYGKEGDDSILGGTGNDQLFGGAGNDYLSGGKGNDSLKGGLGNDSLRGGDGNDVFIYQTGNEVILDYASGDKISVGAAISKASVSGSDVIFTIGSNTLTVKDGKGKSLSLIDSAGKESIYGGSSNSTLMTVTNSTVSPVTIASGVVNVDASKRTSAIQLSGNELANSIVGGTGNDKIYGKEGNDSILGGTGNDQLFGGAGNDYLSGGKGNDSLKGGLGNDSLRGGDGNDVFIYQTGNEVILDYAAGDKISLGAAISKSAVSGSDVVFTIGSNTLTVKDGKGKSLSLIDSAGKSSTTIVGGSADLLILDNSSKSPVTLGSAIKTADASSRTKAIKITGNKLDNLIIGGSGNDTLYGGTGNDSLWGNKGADTYLFCEGDGKDVIFGFDGSDMLLITGAFTGTYNSSKKEIAFKVGSTANAVTLKDYTATTFNVNGFDYQISGTKLVKS